MIKMKVGTEMYEKCVQGAEVEQDITCSAVQEWGLGPLRYHAGAGGTFQHRQ